MADVGTAVSGGCGKTILVLNGGSSSIKFSMYSYNGEAAAGSSLRSMLEGQLDGIGSPRAKLRIVNAGEVQESRPDAVTPVQARDLVFEAIAEATSVVPDAVGHRVVHPGPKLQGHQRVTPGVLKELERAVSFAPLHEPEAIQLIRASMQRYSMAAHYVCFDTVFHDTMPEEATTYPLPSKYQARGVRRYGFHGLSCESIIRQLAAAGDVPKRMVIAHLGSGCSVTALIDGCSVDTSMGITPTGGVIMGTRSGDLDPGLVLYLLREQQGEIEQALAAVETLLNHESGVATLSGMGNDVKAIRAASAEGDERAGLALRVFTRSIKKMIGGYSWLLGGLDAVVFSGGIGEHDPLTRAEVLRGLQDLGVELDASESASNTGSVQRISSIRSRTEVLIVPAQEDLMIALHVQRMASSDDTLQRIQPQTT